MFTLQNTNMQTLYDLLVCKMYLNCCKIQFGHHLPPQMKNDPADKKSMSHLFWECVILFYFGRIFVNAFFTEFIFVIQYTSFCYMVITALLKKTRTNIFG